MRASATQWTVVIALSMMLGWAPTLAGQVKSSNPGGRLPSTGVSTQEKVAPVARLVLNGKGTSNEKASAYRTALHNARKALAVGKIDLARNYVAQAKGMKADLSHSDSPQNVEKMISRHHQLTDLYRNKDASYNQKTAEFLLKQSWELSKYGDWQGAELLASSAVKFEAKFDNFEVKPAQVFAKIRQLKAAPAASGQLKTRALALMSQMQLAMDQNRLRDAADLSRQLSEMKLADSLFGPNDPRPWKLALQLESKLRGSSVAPAGFNSGQDSSKVVAASAMGRQDDRRSAIDNYLSGIRAEERNDRAAALRYFNQAWQGRNQLSQDIQVALDRKLATLRSQVPAIPASATLGGAQERPSALGGNSDLIVQKLRSHVIRKRAHASQLRKDDRVEEALTELKKLRSEIEASSANPVPKSGLIRVVDREIKDLGAYIKAHKSEIENRNRNDVVRQEVATERANRYNDEQKIQDLTKEFNSLMKEHRYAEAEAIARQAQEINDRLPAVITMVQKSKIARRDYEGQIARDIKERAQFNALQEVDHNSFIQVEPVTFAPNFRELSARRRAASDARSISNPAEHAIWQRIRNQQVQPDFKGTSLAEAVAILGKTSGINILLDHAELEKLNIDSSSPVDFSLNSPISLESALKEIGGSKGLYLSVQNEVVKLTSKAASQNLKMKVEYVADLVTPIPNFTATSPITMMVGSGIVAGGSSPYVNVQGAPQAVGALAPGQNGPSSINPLALAQYSQDPSFAGIVPGGNGAPLLRSPSSALGGGTQADFNSLISLIQQTISPTIWEDDGGESGASITPFGNTNSLVIRAPQNVHDDIQKLLKRLRELQDVQIVIETRFITLTDNFFERIGVDFDFQLDDNSGFTNNTIGNLDDQAPSIVVGRNPDGQNGLTLPTDLDIPFNQGSFTSAVPQFGGFDVGTAANFGFAILSDIEVFFLIQAAKGDTRSNVMLAPKITLFNGQQGNIQDTVSRNFVTSVNPVVGSFAAAQAPVITTLQEGTMLSVTAVTSKDRRYVRMTLVPTFTSIRGVESFTFSGRSEVDSGTRVFDPTNGVFQNNQTTVTEGVSVQLPQFAQTQISTTVAVPDGGTILLGGVKRLNEARTERGVPFLSNLPGINRLFKNTGIGRETSSLMMMVTPRVIIKEEQENEQVGP